MKKFRAAAVIFAAAAPMISIDSKYALAFGNRDRNARIHIVNATVDSKLKSSLDTDMGASEEDIYIANARCIFTLNGQGCCSNLCCGSPNDFN